MYQSLDPARLQTLLQGAAPPRLIDVRSTALTDADSPQLASLTVTLQSPPDGASEVLSADTSGTALTASYAGGVLTITGSDSAANYQSVLRTVPSSLNASLTTSQAYTCPA